MIALGAAVVAFGKHAVKVEKVSANGKRVYVAGSGYSGWTKATNVKAAS